MPLLSCSDIVKLYGPDQVLAGVSFQVERGEHVALVGVNGSGKSTLLRIIAGLDSSDRGQVSLARNAIVTYVSQHAEFRYAHTLWEAMLDVFGSARDAHARMREIEQTLGSAGETDELRAEYRCISAIAEHAGYDYESRIERVLAGLELDESQWNKPVDQLSGGQRTRANLSRALLKESDLLLLDEPTNHLDVGAIEWLEKYLSAQSAAYIVVAHDRYFLDSVSKRTIELTGGRVEDYPAGYSGFVRLRAERRARAQLEYEKQQEHIAATEDFVRRFGAGQRSKEAKGRQKQLERLERIERPEESRKLRVKLQGTRRKGDAVLRLSNLGAGYGGKTLVQAPTELVVAHGARVAIVGPNGAGKTTLARTLIGQLPPSAGSYTWAPGAVPAYYAQSQASIFGPDETVLGAFEHRFTIGEEAARNYLGRFLFQGDEVTKRVGDLSGGEQSRLALATLLYSHPNVMLLDEPTNHLDIEAREALEAALSGFNGSLVLISHDRFLIDRLATEMWSIENGRVVVYDGNWSDLVAGRGRRRLEYPPESPAAADGARPERHPEPRHANHATPRKVGRSPATVSQDLAAVQEHLQEVAERAQNAAPTASVDDLSALIDRFDGQAEELGRLANELIESASATRT